MPLAKIKQSFLYRINKKYDQVKEPRRVLIMFALVMPGIFGITLPAATTWTITVGMSWLFVLLIIRFCYIERIGIRKKV